MALKVSDIGEKELINYILSQSSDIIADDTAVTPLSNSNLISTCDMLIESKHFPQGMSYFDMGFKSVTVNVSDLAAMGADPLAFLLSIAVYRDLKVDDFKEIIKGVISACEFYEIPLIGGDTNEASEIIISGTALGLCDNPLMKNTSNEGDLICLTDKVGLAALGFELSGDNIYIKKALKPLARLREGKIIRKANATSCTDITDGLASEMYEMKPDNLGFMIYEDKLEISDEFKELSRDLNLDYLDLILHVGEDFELLFTIDKDNDLDIDFMVIGEVNTSDKIEITLSNGEVKEIKNKGYNHYVS